MITQIIHFTGTGCKYFLVRYIKLGIHDYNVSYLEEKQNGIQLYGVTVYFTSGSVGLAVKENYSDFKKKFHQI
ncbi:hypothetical protein CFY87_05915 [Actinobacillus seminis]|uniref:Uncharacterized protein n=1 Tax=Actinobacillus seminis TaxID=722 RepID=A0A263HBQ5_9PAST|nr:hypothetical protein [Actinobacillus seminis]OZN24870.1 hypothetical protein CFY87_05915 [Actinobacillus seminis]SUU36701.1 Uncharacterised protein [Actinobacillus seminis]